MMTLFASPFENDATEILEWGYGPDAKRDYVINVGALGQRPGQAFMNALFVADPAEYDRLSGSLVDPFYRDDNLPAAIDKLTSK